jgi:hypothetical protein
MAFAPSSRRRNFGLLRCKGMVPSTTGGRNGVDDNEAIDAG